MESHAEAGHVTAVGAWTGNFEATVTIDCKPAGMDVKGFSKVVGIGDIFSDSDL